MLNFTDSSGNSALHLAVQYSFTDVVRALNSVGAKSTIRNNVGDTATSLASRGENSEIQKLLPEDVQTEVNACGLLKVLKIKVVPHRMLQLGLLLVQLVQET